MYRSGAESDGWLAGMGPGLDAPAPAPGAAPVVALALDQIVPPAPARRWQGLVARPLSWIDLSPDLGADIGSRRWFKGLGTVLGLAAVALALWPGIEPLEAAPPIRYDADARDIYRSNAIAPLALGGDTGQRMAPGAAVRYLAAAPERPRISVMATLRSGDSLPRMLGRAGLSQADIAAALALVGQNVEPASIAPGTQIDITLGRRPAPGSPRPLENLAFRARFDLELAVSRGEGGGPLALTRKAIRVDDTPLRIRGTVGDSLYRSARAAGAPASAVQAYLRALSEQVEIEGALRPGDTFDLIVQHRRAATGEAVSGPLLFAGVERAGKPRVQLMRWGRDGRFYEASGIGEQRSGLMAPVPGPTSSRFGLRRHPILGYTRMHSGLDYKAGYGQPIVAVADGAVLSAGRAGGCGIAVRLAHEGSLQTRYCHMSRMAVSPGQQVRRGQVIGYVGSTGLSTGSHLHYEMYRGGRAVDPASVRYVTRAQLTGAELASFRASLATLKTVEAGAALASLAPAQGERGDEAPLREIDRLAPKR